MINPTSVLEVSYGAGAFANYLLQQTLKRPARFDACDLSLDAVSNGIDPLINFRESSIYHGFSFRSLWYPL
jgi:hypothetical protein